MPKYVRFLAVGLLAFASAAEAARKKQRAQVKQQSQSGALASKQDGSEEFYPEKGTCKVQRLQDICECNQWSLGAWGYKCSGCKDKFKWGYGCSLACPTQCSRGCDFSGNCIPDPNAPNVPKTCKRNSRIADQTDKSVTTNERNECQACDGPFYGLMCEHKCPDKCAKTAEGTCGRGGECYECEEGYHGETCSEKCSPGCPTCVMVDGLVAADEAGEFLPQGFCNVECTTDKHGDTCELPCPDNCKKFSGKASCGKDTGFCKQCDGRKWHGDTCNKPCNEGCIGGTCDKNSATCDDGCKKGWWGDACENACPAGTLGGCDRENGKPSSCGSGSFPSLSDDGTGVCESCPANCKNGVCHADGTCSEGCLLGHFGDAGEKECEPTCDGACDAHTTNKDDGDCAACVAGFHGGMCKEKCHATCKSCTQHATFFSRIGKDDCTSCPEDEPSVLTDSGECKCIEGASRKDGPQSRCICDEPKDAARESFFELTHNDHKRCRSICKSGTKEVFGDMSSTCMDTKKYKSVMWAGLQGGLKQGRCSDDHLEIPIRGSEDSECIRSDYVSNIVSL